MRIDKLFRHSVYVLPVLAVTSMAVAEGGLLYLVFFAALAAAFYAAETRGKAMLTRRAGTLLTCAAFLFAILEARYIAETPSFAMGHFLIVTQFIYLLMDRTGRNYATLFAMALVTFILASTMTTQMIFSLELIAFVFGGMWTMVVFNIYAETRGEAVAKVEVTRRWFTGLAAGCLFTLAIAVVVFIAIPRLNLPPLAQAGPLPESMSGFSDEVRLGELAGIKDNPEKIMRIWVYEDGQPAKVDRLLVRGIALERFDGKAWSTDPNPGAIRDRFFIVEGGFRDTSGTIEKFEVEPVGVKALFSVYPKTFDATLMPPEVNRTQSVILSFDRLTDSIVLSHDPTQRLEYAVRMGKAAPHRVSPLSARLRSLYTSLPPILPLRVGDLARSIASGRQDAFAVASAVENYLTSNYGYTLAVPDSGSADPIDQFLFEWKRGHCEYFASAMVVLLRSVGIPARVVNGFAEGEWNEIGNYYVIRQKDAHSWVEAFIDDMGWVTFDPTPAAGRNFYGSGYIARLRSLYDSAEYGWITNVVNFGYDNQGSVLAGVGRVIHDIADLSNLSRSALAGGLRMFAAGKLGAIVIALAAAGLVVLALRSLRRPGKGPRKQRRSAARSVRFYSRLLKLLRRKGFARPASSAPMEFARRVVERGGPQFLPAELITSEFCAVRYGGKELNPQRERMIREAFEDLDGAPSIKLQRQRTTR